MQAQVFRVPMSNPSDVSGVAKLVDEGVIRAEEVVCVLGKTEGNGCVNDFTRGYTTLAFKVYFSEKLGVSRQEIGERIAFIMSGGTEGVMTPHCTIFTVQKTDNKQKLNPEGKRLAVQQVFTREFLPEEIGRMAQITETADAVRRAMSEAGIADASDVHFVQVKCPLLTAGRMHDAVERGQKVVTEDTYESMGYSRGASALGIALALGEVERGSLSDEVITADYGLYSSVASTSAGIELMNNEIIVMGNSSSWGGDLVIGHAEMKDAIDGTAVRQVLRDVGCCKNDLPTADELSRVVNVFAKAEASPDGEVRNRRHTMLDDSDINSTRHARAVVNAVIASIVGDPMVYVSGGAEHQGPAGGGPVAVIARAAQ
jgi:cyanuric acid amidohydrolase